MKYRFSTALPGSSTGFGSLRLARLAWYPVAAAAFGLFLISMPGYLVLVPRGFELTANQAVQSSNLILAINILSGILSVASIVLSFFLAVVLFRRRPHDRMALFLSYFLLVVGNAAGPSDALLLYLPDTVQFLFQIVILFITLPMSMFLFALFPDGRFVPSWTRWLGFGSFLVVILMATVPSVGYALLFISLFLMFFAQIYRYRNVSNQEQKLQTKWFVYGYGLLLALLVIVSIPRTWSAILPPIEINPVWEAGSLLLYFVAFAVIPVTLTISVMRYRLYDIDILINRTLVYGLLTALTMAIYVFAVGFLGNVLQSQNRTIIAFLTTGLVALLFQPLRSYLQQQINRLMYGERDDPMSVLEKMGQQLEETILYESDLVEVVETIAHALKLPHVEIVITKNDQREIAASIGRSDNKKIELPLQYQGEEIGSLVVAQRGSGEEFSPKEMMLLENIARQASAAVYSVRLTTDLKRSRQQLVTTREEERRRLRRDLHDGLGASLAALHLQTGALRRAIGNDPDQARLIVDEFKTELHEAIADIRRVAYELRPPALDELGLTAALRSLAASFSKSSPGMGEGNLSTQTDRRNLDVRIDTPGDLPQLPAAIEVAVYRIVQEALTNVVNHSRADNCRVSLTLGEECQLVIIDDGIGIPAEQPWGVGMTSMCERATELGGICRITPAASGGTQVWASFPILIDKGM
jgi:signal transduction histidine kinase